MIKTQRQKDLLKQCKLQMEKLPNYRTLSGYWVSSFSNKDLTKDELMNNNEMVKGLKEYLETLELYIAVIRKLVDLQEEYYQKYINNKEVEPINQREWRNGMLYLYLDARSKYDHWKSYIENDGSDIGYKDNEIIEKDYNNIFNGYLLGLKVKNPYYIEGKNEKSNILPPKINPDERKKRSKQRDKYKIKTKRNEAYIDKIMKSYTVPLELKLDKFTLNISEIIRVIKWLNFSIETNSDEIKNIKKLLACPLNPFLAFEETIELEGNDQEYHDLTNLVYEGLLKGGKILETLNLIYYIIGKDKKIQTIMKEKILKQNDSNFTHYIIFNMKEFIQSNKKRYTNSRNTNSTVFDIIFYNYYETTQIIHNALFYSFFCWSSNLDIQNKSDKFETKIFADHCMNKIETLEWNQWRTFKKNISSITKVDINMKRKIYSMSRLYQPVYELMERFEAMNNQDDK